MTEIGAGPGDPDTDRIVALYILDSWRGDHPGHEDCPSLRATDAYAVDGTGDQGTDRAWFSAVVSCEHQKPAKYGFGEFGTAADIIGDVARDYDSMQDRT